MAQVTKVEAPPGPAAARDAAPKRRDVSLGRAARWGSFGGLTLVFVASIGMVATFEARSIVSPYLTLGYLTLYLIALTYGYLAGRPPPHLEGYEPPRRGPRNALAGLIAGALAGAILSLFMLFVSVINVRGIFPNVSPQLLDVLTFDRDLGVGILVTLAWTAVLGVAGGALHLIPERWRRPLVAALLWTLTFGLLREAVEQVLRGIKLSTLSGLLFGPRGGLSVTGAAIVAVAFFALYAYLEPRRGSLRRRIDGLPAPQRQRYAIGAIVALVVFLAVLPLILGSFLSNVLDFVGIFLLMALGLNIVVGFAGLLDLGYVAFFAVGAYAGAVLTSPQSPRFNPELAFWTALPFIVLAAAFAGLLVGTPVLRMRGDYLAIVTLGFGEIARILFLSDWFKPVFGGAQGITRIPDISVGPLELNAPTELFYPIAGFILLAAYISWALQDSRMGRAWMAMREDEAVAEVMGINIVTAKLSAFIVGAILASFGGALFGTRIGSIFPQSFSIIVSIIVLVIIIVGGMGNMVGVAVGALVLVGIPEFLREFEEYRFLLYGALLIFMMLNKPEGLVPSKRRAQELHQEEILQDAWGGEREQRAREVPASSPEAEESLT
jgi:branched-chain amino acid transport system permease protein